MKFSGGGWRGTQSPSMYKLTTEHLKDVHVISEHIPGIVSVKTESEGIYPYDRTVWTFESEYSLRYFVRELNALGLDEASETVNYLDVYTGERSYPEEREYPY